MKSVIFESEHLLVAHLQKAASPAPVFVTFNEMGFRPNGANFWGDVIFSKLPFSAVGVVSRTPNWFPAAEMREAAARIKEATPDACRITYGFSQGAYGALKFSSALEARGVLAFGPQWSIDPVDVGHFDTRYLAYYKSNLDNGRKIVAEDVGTDSFVFFDPYLSVDAHNVARLGELPGVQTIPCPFSGHGPIHLLTEAHKSATFLEEAAAMIAAGRQAPEIAGSLRRIIRDARAKSRTYAAQRTIILRQRRKLSLVVGLKRSSYERLSPTATLSAAMQQNDAAAVGKLIPFLTFEDVNPAGVINVWRYVRDAGLTDAELRLADMMLGEGKSAFVRLHAVNSYIGLNLLHMARLALHDIVVRYGLTTPGEAQAALNFAHTLGAPELERIAREMLNGA